MVVKQEKQYFIHRGYVSPENQGSTDKGSKQTLVDVVRSCK